MSERDMLSLPDEVKLKIFEYLDGVSKQELSKVCSDLSRIYQDRHVMQYVKITVNIVFLSNYYILQKTEFF